MNSPALFTTSITITLIVLSVFTAAPARASVDSEKVAQQFREFCLQESTDHGQRILDDIELPTSNMSEAMRLIKSQKSDGSWPDLNYESRARSALGTR